MVRSSVLEILKNKFIKTRKFFIMSQCNSRASHFILNKVRKPFDSPHIHDEKSFGPGRESNLVPL